MYFCSRNSKKGIMAAGKWIGGFIGWMAGGPLGALAGYLLGSLFDSMLDGVNTPDNSGTWGSGSQRDGGYSRQRSYQDYNEAYQRAYRQRQQQGQRNSFLFSLLVLSSYIIKAEGKAMHSEMEMVRQMLRQNFGQDAVQFRQMSSSSALWSSVYAFLWTISVPDIRLWAT